MQTYKVELNIEQRALKKILKWRRKCNNIVMKSNETNILYTNQNNGAIYYTEET